MMDGSIFYATVDYGGGWTYEAPAVPPRVLHDTTFLQRTPASGGRLAHQRALPGRWWSGFT
jgi:hypothetical protein